VEKYRGLAVSSVHVGSAQDTDYSLYTNPVLLHISRTGSPVWRRLVSLYIVITHTLQKCPEVINVLVLYLHDRFGV
jgi:hypothetical protein